MPAPDGALEAALDGLAIASEPTPRSTRRGPARHGAVGVADGVSTGAETREEILAPWMARLERREVDKRAPLDLLNEEIDAFLEWVRPTEEERKLRHDVFILFKRVVGTVFPRAKVELFGSMATGLYLPDGDFDVVISSPTFATVPTNTLLLKLKQALLASDFVRHDDLSLITGARVPIVKLRSAPEFGSFHMDVCFNSLKGPLGAQESLRLLEEVDRTRPEGRKRAEAHALLLKTLLRTHGLDEVRFGGLSGMSIFCLAVSFVQLDRSQGRTLAADFLYLLRKYALSFDFTTQSLSTSNGGAILNKNQWLRPAEIRRDRLSIVHPIEPTRDVAAGSHRWLEVRQKLRAAYGDLSSYIDRGQPLHRLAFSPTKSALSMVGIRASQALLDIRERQRRLIAAGTVDDMVQTWWPENFTTSPRSSVASPVRTPPHGPPVEPKPQASSPDSASSASTAPVGAASPIPPSPERSPGEWLEQQKERLARVQELWQDPAPPTTTSPSLAHPIFAPSPVFAPFGRSPW